MEKNMIPGEARKFFFDAAGEIVQKQSHSASDVTLLKDAMSGICKSYMVEEHMQGGYSQRGSSWDSMDRGMSRDRGGSWGNGMGMMRGNYSGDSGGNSYRMSREDGLQKYLDRMMREAVSERERDIIQQIKELAYGQE